MKLPILILAVGDFTLSVGYFYLEIFNDVHLGWSVCIKCRKF